MTDDLVECPYCGFKSKTVNGIKKHIRHAHDMNTCPVCGLRTKNLAMHLSRRNDKAHKRAYAVLGSVGARHSKRLREVRKEIFGE
jgi:transcription elongation factor Elf1